MFLDREGVEAGDQLEVLHIQSYEVEVEMQCSRSYDEVLKRDRDASGRLLSFDATGELRDFQRDWVNNQGLAQVTQEYFSAVSLDERPGSIDAVCQFNDADGR